MASLTRAAVWLSLLGLAAVVAGLALGAGPCVAPAREAAAGCGVNHWDYVLGVGVGMTVVGVPTAVVSSAYGYVTRTT